MTCAIGILLLGPASAASYAIIPGGASHGPTPDTHVYWAYVLDNSNGKMFLCNVDYTPSSPLVSHCREETSRFKSKLAPSDAIISQMAFSLYDIQVRTPGNGLWQIDNKTGDAQFCIATARAIKVVGDRCLKLDWKSSQ